MTNMPQFRAVMREYQKQSKRDDATIINTKLFYIARGAVGITHRADPVIIGMELNQLLKSEHKWNFVKRYSTRGRDYTVPLVALLINAERKRKGEPGLQGQDMRNAVKDFIGRRKKSAAFIAAGFIPAVKKFEPLAERKGDAPRMDNQVKQRGADKGSAIAAIADDIAPVGVIINYALSKSPTGEKALLTFATAALRTAFDNEMKSMVRYIERKKQETADKLRT